MLIEDGKDLLCNPPNSSSAIEAGCPGPCTGCLLKIYNVRDSTTVLGNLCQCLFNLIAKVFPNVQQEPPLFRFVHIVSGPVTGHHCKKPGSVFFALSHQVFTNIDKTKPSLLQAEQLSQPVLIQEVLLPTDYLHGLLWTCSSRSLSFLSWGPWSWIQCSTWGLMRQNREGESPPSTCCLTCGWHSGLQAYIAGSCFMAAERTINICK